MKCFGPQCVAHFCLIAMRFQKDAKYFRNSASGQLQLNQLFPKDLYRLTVTKMKIKSLGIYQQLNV